MKIALIDHNIVYKVWDIEENQKELTIRYDLPNGASLSPISKGWSNGIYSIEEVQEFQVPENKKIIGSPSYSIENKIVIETYDVEDIPPPPVPDRVTSRQFKLQLLAFPAIGKGETLLDDVEAWISTQSRAAQVAFENSGTFVRTEPMMQAGFAALGFSEGQIDAFFTAASEL